MIVKNEWILEPMKRKKIFVLGDSGVGKTSFISRILNQNQHESYDPTIGIVIRNGVIDEKDRIIFAEFWDFSGNPIFHQALGPEWFVNVDVLIFMADLSNTTSIQDLKRWFELAGVTSRISEHRPIIILLNKADIVPRNTVKEIFSTQLVRSLTSRCNEIIPISVKDEMSIQHVRQTLANSIDNTSKTFTRSFQFLRRQLQLSQY